MVKVRVSYIGVRSQVVEWCELTGLRIGVS